MPTYAANTDVTSDKSRAEIERTLTRYGATHFGYMSEPGRALVAFQKGGRQVRFIEVDEMIASRVPGRLMLEAS